MPTLDQWLDMEFSSAAGKQALLCAILRHYSLHDLTVKHTETPLSSEAALERGAALYYLGKYAECREVLEHIAWYSPTPIQRCQASYLTSSACFYLGDTTAAKTESQHQVALAEQLQDLGELQTALNHAAALAYSLGNWTKHGHTTKGCWIIRTLIHRSKPRQWLRGDLQTSQMCREMEGLRWRDTPQLATCASSLEALKVLHG